jgi:hypothetical protein
MTSTQAFVSVLALAPVLAAVLLLVPGPGEVLGLA